MRIGIAGCGFIGNIHSWALHALEEAGLIDARVTGTFDRDPSRAAEMARVHSAQACQSLDDLLDSVDAAWVCTPTASHLGVVAAAVDRGLPVFCEKPLAQDMERCRRVSELLHQVPHQVGLVLRYSPVFREAEALLDSGRCGRVMAAVLRDDQYFPIQGQYGSDWRAHIDLAGGGTLIEHSVHDFDLLRWLMGDPSDLSATTSSFFGYEGVEDLATVRLGYEGGASATLVSVWHQVLSRPSTRRLELLCEKGVFWCENDYLGPLHLQTAEGVEVLETPPPAWVADLGVPESVRGAIGQYAEPSRAFIECLIHEGARATGFPTVDEALGAHHLVDAAYRSAAAGGAAVQI